MLLKSPNHWRGHHPKSQKALQLVGNEVMSHIVSDSLDFLKLAGDWTFLPHRPIVCNDNSVQLFLVQKLIVWLSGLESVATVVYFLLAWQIGIPLASCSLALSGRLLREGQFLNSGKPDPKNFGTVLWLGFISGSEKPYCSSLYHWVLRRCLDSLPASWRIDSELARMLAGSFTDLARDWFVFFINVPSIKCINS